jgi:hypothetical protein
MRTEEHPDGGRRDFDTEFEEFALDATISGTRPPTAGHPPPNCSPVARLLGRTRDTRLTARGRTGRL